MSRSGWNAALALLALLVAACGDSEVTAVPPSAMTLGAPLADDALCDLQLGVSSVEQVRGLFGDAPLSGETGGQELLQYVYVDDTGVVQESTLFWFDGDQILQKVDRLKKAVPVCLQPAAQ
jgi:hypothetical protein